MKTALIILAVVVAELVILWFALPWLSGIRHRIQWWRLERGERRYQKDIAEAVKAIINMPVLQWGGMPKTPTPEDAAMVEFSPKQPYTEAKKIADINLNMRILEELVGLHHYEPKLNDGELEYIIRTRTNPPFTGEITAESLKQAGLMIVLRKVGGNDVRYLAQKNSDGMYVRLSEDF